MTTSLTDLTLYEFETPNYKKLNEEQMIRRINTVNNVEDEQFNVKVFDYRGSNRQKKRVSKFVVYEQSGRGDLQDRHVIAVVKNSCESIGIEARFNGRYRLRVASDLEIRFRD